MNVTVLLCSYLRISSGFISLLYVINCHASYIIYKESVWIITVRYTKAVSVTTDRG